MASVIEFRLPVTQFALAHTFEAVPGLHIEVERFAAQDPDTTMPFVRVTTDDFETFERAVDDDPSVDVATPIADYGDERLYRIHWIGDVERVVRFLLKEDGAITTAQATGESWEFRAMYPERDSLSAVYGCCEENGLSLTVDAIYELEDNGRFEHGLTDAQHTSLLTAKEMGYYDVPRRTSLSDLSEELGVSHQALSERLRRGHANLIDRTLRSKGGVQIENPPEPKQ